MGHIAPMYIKKIKKEVNKMEDIIFILKTAILFTGFFGGMYLIRALCDKLGLK